MCAGADVLGQEEPVSGKQFQLQESVWGKGELHTFWKSSKRCECVRMHEGTCQKAKGYVINGVLWGNGIWGGREQVPFEHRKDEFH